MPLRPAPKRKPVDYRKVDELQTEIFGLKREEDKQPPLSKTPEKASKQTASKMKTLAGESGERLIENKTDSGSSINKDYALIDDKPAKKEISEGEKKSAAGSRLGEHLSDLETIAVNIAATKAGQGRTTTRPFTIPRTLIIDTTRIKSKFRTIDEQFTQNVIVDYLLREALAAVTPENYKNLKNQAFEFVKRPDETTRRSLTVTEEVIYQMSELKAGINLETGRKYSNDEIFSTLLALGVSWLYKNGVLS